MKKILIDIDILTIGLWEKKDPRKFEALKFLKRVEEGEFFVYFLDEHMKVVSEWKHGVLKNRILKKIADLQNQFVELSDILAQIENKTTKKAEEFVDEFTKFTGSKSADILLVLTCSLLEIDYLVTLNRKHLQSIVDDISFQIILMPSPYSKDRTCLNISVTCYKRAKIEEFLRWNKMYVPKILLPSEI